MSIVSAPWSPLIGVLPQHEMLADVRFGSQADIRSAKERVRFTPESRHVRCTRDVRYGPKADIGLLGAMSAFAPKDRAGSPRGPAHDLLC